ncbi:nuclease-related domain-containing protein [Streptomyces indicus]|uniref:Nuclease-related domain-containing protein n=1 Tax=Streptomyces indicus TaxID=417292 RepID=A0A1G8WIK3_9ACTN|nr:nuclease-related domain-containing protein [Streptomyces indicus]SDJ78189.1 Nuclease-related domain-containing protein [Streptomyces indicus]
MTGLRVVPTWRHGHERYYVLLPDGRNIAWYDREAGRVNLLKDERRQEVLAALAPYLTGPVTVGAPPVPTGAELARLALHPDDDLAPNRPGEALLIALDRHPTPVRRLRTDRRRRDLLAQQAVGEALDRLEPAGWRVLHSLPLPGGRRLDHLLIGPGGVFAFHALHATKHRVRVADPQVAVGRAQPEPLLGSLRHQADRACLALTTEVRPVLAVVAATAVDLRGALREVQVVEDTGIPSFATLGGVYKPTDIEALYAHARDRRTWLRT